MKDLHTAKLSWVTWKHSTFPFPKHYHRKTKKFSQLQNLKKHPTYSETVPQAPKVVSESSGGADNTSNSFQKENCFPKPGSLSPKLQPWRVKGGRLIRWDIRQQVSGGAGLHKYTVSPVTRKKLSG